MFIKFAYLGVETIGKLISEVPNSPGLVLVEKFSYADVEYEKMPAQILGMMGIVVSNTPFFVKILKKDIICSVSIIHRHWFESHNAVYHCGMSNVYWASHLRKDSGAITDIDPLVFPTNYMQCILLESALSPVLAWESCRLDAGKFVTCNDNSYFLSRCNIVLHTAVILSKAHVEGPMSAIIPSFNMRQEDALRLFKEIQERSTVEDI
jgi:hypothetical protein